MQKIKKVKYPHVKEWRKTLKTKLMEAFGGKCACCNLIDDPCVYDFHHIDPSTKEFQMSTSKTAKWEKFCEEAQKCIMVCSHCHRKLHSGLIEFPTIYQKFDISLVVSYKENYQTIKRREKDVKLLVVGKGIEP